MHLKVFVKLKKTLKTLSSRQKNPKKPKKTQKNPKKPTGLGFFKKTQVFFQPCYCRSNTRVKFFFYIRTHLGTTIIIV
jgi:hypothetical protein